MQFYTTQNGYRTNLLVSLTEGEQKGLHRIMRFIANNPSSLKGMRETSETKYVIKKLNAQLSKQ